MIACHDEETIIARCTPSGPGAIALLRVSGTHSFAITDRISKLASGKSLSDSPSHTIHFGWVMNEQTRLDQVLFLLMRAPNSFTGQDTIEITCHNNPFIIDAIIERAIHHGARLALPGEFTKRAVINQKIDLLQAEAINELIHANTQLTLKQSLSQLEGSLSSWTHEIERDLIKALALSDASFEFIDEEYLEFGQEIGAIINTILERITLIKKNFDQQARIRQGIRIAILGSVNAGKSSLFNAMIGANRAIVTDIAGTTRDVIEAGLYRDGNYWTLIDTAGLRQTNDIIEQEGIKRSFEQAELADIILLVFDGARQETIQERELYAQLMAQHTTKTVAVRNKSDVLKQAPHSLDAYHPLCVSSITSHNVICIQEAIQRTINLLLSELSSPFLLNNRQFLIILEVEKRLHALKALFGKTIPYELVSYHLNDALSALCELTGKSISERAMDAVFREFCVGK